MMRTLSSMFSDHVSERRESTIILTRNKTYNNITLRRKRASVEKEKKEEIDSLGKGAVLIECLETRIAVLAPFVSNFRLVCRGKDVVRIADGAFSPSPNHELINLSPKYRYRV